MKSHLRAAVVVFVLLTLVTGVAYPLLVTAIGQGVFPHRANGSLIRDQAGDAVGSELIAQPFDAPHYFWGRPSATSPSANNAAASSGSNLGPTNPDLHKAIADRVEAIRKAHPDQTGLVPADLATASASGLDPHISPAAAEYQVARVAAARGGVSADEVRKLVTAHTEPRTLGVLGEARVNVLTLNRELDAKFPVRAAGGP
ncbi:MAG TPA: potassium-transporting ATPase subunit KdpC [Gemmataceae bacterium]|nr:potassium-transporting ATPase subunit KdpC [Gemmataceae bacterium]